MEETTGSEKNNLVRLEPGSLNWSVPLLGAASERPSHLPQKNHIQILGVTLFPFQENVLYAYASGNRKRKPWGGLLLLTATTT
jgi:hypothetical protein